MSARIFALSLSMALFMGSNVAAQFLVDTYFDYTINASRRNVLRAYRVLPGAGIVSTAEFDVANSALGSDLDPIVFDPRSAELWSASQLNYPFPPHLRRFELQNGQVVPTQDTIPVRVTTANGARFDDDGFLVVCTNLGTVTTVDLLERRIVRTMQIQNVGSWGLGVQWFEPARRGRPAMAEFNEVLPGIDRQVIGTLDERGAVVQRLYSANQTSFPPVFYSRSGITTDNGRSFVSGLPLRSAPLFGLYEVTSSGLVRRTEVSHLVGAMLEDASRGILHLVSVEGGRVEFDYVSNQARFVAEPQILSFAWNFSLGHFPKQRLQISPARPAANAAFDAVVALGGNPSDLGLVLFRHATVGGIPQLELNSLVALAPFDANGLQRTVLRYDPALFGLQAGDELRFQGFGWNGSSLWSTPEQVMRWR